MDLFRESALALFVWVALVTASSHLRADTFCVSTTSEFIAAITAAQGNGRDDTLHVVQGVYPWYFVYNSGESNGLVIEGGYTAGCGSRVVDPANTVIDAGDGWRVLQLSSTQPADFRVDGITLMNGAISLPGAGGGGLYTSTDGGRVTLTNDRFEGNYAATSGGGVYVVASMTTLDGNTFVGNHAAYLGGGAFVSSLSGGTAVLSNNLLFENSAGTNGGAAGVWNVDTAVLSNNLVRLNTAVGPGGGIDLQGIGQTVLVHNTVTYNTSSGRGGGLRFDLFDDADLGEIYNNIIWGNSAPQAADIDLDNDGDANGTASSVDLFDNDFDQGPAGYAVTIPFPVDSSNFDNVDPLYVDAGGDDYHLQASSPLIDAGDEGAPYRSSADLDGNPRLMDAGVDLGVYEYSGAVPPTPDIRVDGLDGPLSVHQGELLTAAVSLIAGIESGSAADWWLYAETPFGIYSYDAAGGSWSRGIAPSHQGPLFDLGPLEFLRISGLPAGTYTLTFGVDTAMNGTLDPDLLRDDAAEVTVTP